MYVAQEYLLEFHRAMNIAIGDPRKPELTDDLNESLSRIEEEVNELLGAVERAGFEYDNVEFNSPEHLAAIAKESADAIYTIVSFAIRSGIDLAPVFEAVHRSNMTKRPLDPSLPRTKVSKGVEYEPADVAAVMAETADFYNVNPEAGWSA